MAEKTFRLEIISPDKVFYTNDVVMAEYNTVEGEVGIYAEHIPMTQIIAPGRLIITEEEGQKTAALLSGFVEITKNQVTILAEAVEWPQNIDVSRAEEARIRAERILSSDQGGMDLKRAENALLRALTRLDVAEKYKGR
ncbi:MAG: ATP synthase F1 subunit epsilon [Eubacteriales bacterium]|nr:ATP synthase F1 subunit epsilon [Eubacteriales bacterium]